MTTGKTQRYILTFRCVNCGKHEVSVTYPSEDIVNEDELRARIYQASCNSCGWTGNACGFSAILISQSGEFKARAAGHSS
jgi:transcription elongation factor Elf1